MCYQRFRYCNDGGDDVHTEVRWFRRRSPVDAVVPLCKSPAAVEAVESVVEVTGSVAAAAGIPEVAGTSAAPVEDTLAVAASV